MAVGLLDWAAVRALWMNADPSAALATIDRLRGCARPARVPSPGAPFIMVAGALLAARLAASAARRDATPAEPSGALVALASRGLFLAEEAGQLLRELRL